MDRTKRFNKDSSYIVGSGGESKGSIKTPTLQKKMVESRRKTPQNAPDLTDFMNDMFFGTATNEKKAYNLTGGRLMDEEVDFDDSTRSNSSRLTQEWLEEAKRMVASSPTRCESPSRLVGSPKFASAQARLPTSSIIDRKDPLNRSARRHRSVEGLGEEILNKSARHGRNNSVSLDTSSTAPSIDQSPAAAVHKWFSNILKPSNSNPTPTPPVISSPDPTVDIIPHRHSTHRKSRFQKDNPAPQPQGISTPSRRTFKTTEPTSTELLLSPPKNLIQSAHRRTLSSSSCSIEKPLSPPKNLLESVHRMSLSKSTCSTEKVVPKSKLSNGNNWFKEANGSKELSLNEFLKEQKFKVEKIVNREVDCKAKIVLPGPSNSTSSMVAAICYAWLLENRVRKSKVDDDNAENYVVLPVMNVRRGRMWKQRQAAWLFHHVGLDASSLLFADELDLDSLLMSGQLSIIVVGQDALKPDGEVGSQCTILTDNYCEDAYDLLQTPMLKKFLLAGILLDTQNLDTNAALSMTRDAEAVQLLLVGSPPNYRNALFDLLIQDQGDNSFIEALRDNYGRSPNENGQETGEPFEHKVQGRKSAYIPHQEAMTQNLHKNTNDLRNAKTDKNSTNPAKPNSLPAQATVAPATQPDASRGKNKNFLSKWFGFGSK